METEADTVTIVNKIVNTPDNNQSRVQNPAGNTKPLPCRVRILIMKMGIDA